MIAVEKISLYDFAKMAIGGGEPDSVTFLDSDMKTVTSKIEFFGLNDYIPSVKFSTSDLMIRGDHTSVLPDRWLAEFPGLT